MAGDEPIAGVIINEAREQAFALGVGPGPVFVMVGRKLGLDGGPYRAVDQGRMLAGIPNTPVLDLPYIKRVGQYLVDVTAGKGQTPDRSASGRRIWFGREIEAHEFGLNSLDIFEFQKQIKDGSDGEGFGFIHDNGPVLSC